MRPPNIRLTDIGSGRETILLYSNKNSGPGNASLDQDAEGNWIQTPTGAISYPAIVNRNEATITEGNGAIEAATSYGVMIYSATDPGIMPDYLIVWNDHILVAAGQAESDGPGAWSVNAIETTPNAGGSSIPYNYQA